ncbi:DUF6053 domain-containing protein [Lysobacter enzymogenes]|uniref:DUF6053 domain-containing protein n=1 Tax=Lysobacter enzymogenes TaxID=69 RepID=UPI003D187F8E
MSSTVSTVRSAVLNGVLSGTRSMPKRMSVIFMCRWCRGMRRVRVRRGAPWKKVSRSGRGGERRFAAGRFYVGGPSGPALLFRAAATWAERTGPKGPPAKAGRIVAGLMDEYVECW